MVHQEKIRLSNYRHNLQKAIVSAMAFSFFRRTCLLGCVIPFFLSSCNSSDFKEPLIYEGPQRIFENVESYYSENNQVKVKIIAALVYEFESGDREFPKG